MPYPAGFRSRLVQRMLEPDPVSACELARETGIHQTTLSRWLRDALTLPSMSRKKKTSPPPADSPTPPAPRRPSDFSAEEKLAAVVESERIPEAELGAWLRARGLHKADVDGWRRVLLSALQRKPAKASGSQEGKRIRALEKELGRKEKALAEAAALLVLKKKVQAIWGGEDDSTAERRGN